jgi:hypothetical protein
LYYFLFIRNPANQPTFIMSYFLWIIRKSQSFTASRYLFCLSNIIELHSNFAQSTTKLFSRNFIQIFKVFIYISVFGSFSFTRVNFFQIIFSLGFKPSDFGIFDFFRMPCVICFISLHSVLKLSTCFHFNFNSRCFSRGFIA